MFRCNHHHQGVYYLSLHQTRIWFRTVQQTKKKDHHSWFQNIEINCKTKGITCDRSRMAWNELDKHVKKQSVQPTDLIHSDTVLRATARVSRGNRLTPDIDAILQWVCSKGLAT